jgi:hypothetical protein
VQLLLHRRSSAFTVADLFDVARGGGRRSSAGAKLARADAASQSPQSQRRSTGTTGSGNTTSAATGRQRPVSMGHMPADIYSSGSTAAAALAAAAADSERGRTLSGAGGAGDRAGQLQRPHSASHSPWGYNAARSLQHLDVHSATRAERLNEVRRSHSAQMLTGGSNHSGTSANGSYQGGHTHSSSSVNGAATASAAAATGTVGNRGRGGSFISNSSRHSSRSADSRSSNIEAAAAASANGVSESERGRRAVWSARSRSGSRSHSRSHSRSRSQSRSPMESPHNSAQGNGAPVSHVYYH